LVEVLHGHGLGQHRQLAEGVVGAAGVEAPEERRIGIDVFAQLLQGACLMGLQLLAGPVVGWRRVCRRPRRRKTTDRLLLPGSMLVPILGNRAPARCAVGVRSCPAGRLLEGL
jgi:hypothetical protein